MPCPQRLWDSKTHSLLGYDLDERFAFTSSRTVTIRDYRLGCALLLARALIVLSAIVGTFGITRAYLQDVTLLGFVRVQPLGPYAQYQFSANATRPAPAYCTDGSTGLPPATNESAAPGILWEKTYARAAGLPPSPRYPCLYLDASDAVTNPLELGATFLPTRIVAVNEAAPRCAPPTNTTPAQCTYAGVPGTRASYYMPDVEWYTIKVRAVGRRGGCASTSSEGRALTPAGGRVCG